MSKKSSILLISFLSFLFFLKPAFAKVVTVDGVGIDRESALRDATRLAVEQVVGTFIDSQTLMEDLIVQLDEVYKKSQGYVKSVKILNEQQEKNMYRVCTIIDVDSSPDGKLMSNLSMILMLNDPRIAVIILDYENSNFSENDPESVSSNQSSISHNTSAERAMNTKLINLGFSHVVDANQIIRLKDAQLLNEIYNGREALNSNIVKDKSIDYLVLGKSRVDVNKVLVPEYGGKGMLETSLIEAKAELEVKVIKYDTGDLVGTFSVDGRGADSTNTRAADKSFKVVAEKAAEELGKTFKKFGSKSTEGLQIIVSTDNYGKVEQLRKDLLGVNGVQNVYIREHNSDKSILEVESTQKSHILLQLLKKKSKLGIFVETISNSTINIKIT